MTLTELSVFMKKQELDLQLVTEKEKEEGEYFILNLDPGFSFFLFCFGFEKEKYEISQCTVLKILKIYYANTTLFASLCLQLSLLLLAEIPPEPLVLNINGRCELL